MHVQNFAIAVGLHFLGILVLKVEKISKGSLNSIPSPSPKLSENSNYRQESLLEVYFQKFVDNAQQCFALLPQVNFPVNNLNFTEGIESRLSS